MVETGGHRSVIDLWLAEAEKLLGKPMARTYAQKNQDVSLSAIRRYAFGIGDDNPLWCDRDYAARTAYLRPLAPPTFLYSVDDTVTIVPRVPGIQVLHGGTAWEFFEPVLEGDRLVSESTIVEVRRTVGKATGPMGLLSARFDYLRQDGKLVARAIGRSVQVAGGESAGDGLVRRQPSRYTPDEIAAIARAVASEQRRGADPRHWEDVPVGDELVPVVKGPLNIRDMVCYYAGNGLPDEIYRAHELAYLDPPVLPMRHLEGLPGPSGGTPVIFDIGHQRIGWIGHLLTNWMGDAGFLAGLDVRISALNISGDITWCRGRVAQKRLQSGAGLVDLEVWTENQLGETTASGRATVRLPRRSDV